MKFYHGTSKENWKKIQDEGVIWGRRFAEGKEISRCTYLAVDIDEAMRYGDVVLEVDYNPEANPRENNYIEGCWQVRVYEPIRIENVTRVQDGEK